jgi:hypothetical protein
VDRRKLPPAKSQQTFAFIVGLVLSGEAIGQFGIGVTVWLNAVLLAVAAFAGRVVPVVSPMEHSPSRSIAKADVLGVGTLLRLRLCRHIVVIAALAAAAMDCRPSRIPS